MPYLLYTVLCIVLFTFCSVFRCFLFTSELSVGETYSFAILGFCVGWSELQMCMAYALVKNKSVYKLKSNLFLPFCSSIQPSPKWCCLVFSDNNIIWMRWLHFNFQFPIKIGMDSFNSINIHYELTINFKEIIRMQLFF